MQYVCMYMGHLMNKLLNGIILFILLIYCSWFRKHVRNPPLHSDAVIPFYFTAKKHGVITLFTVASIAAVEKRPLSYQTPQSVHRARNCGVQTLPLTMHYGGEKLEKEWSDFNPQWTRCYDLGSRLRCKVSSKSSENCDHKRVDRQTDVTDAGEFIICPMLCYSNGTDNKCVWTD